MLMLSLLSRQAPPRYAVPSMLLAYAAAATILHAGGYSR